MPNIQNHQFAKNCHYMENYEDEYKYMASIILKITLIHWVTCIVFYYQTTD